MKHTRSKSLCGFQTLLAMFMLLTPGLAFADLIKINTITPFKAVYLIPDPTDNLIRVNPVVLAGEVDATGPEGMGHYLEHIMYWHADKVNEAPFHGRIGNAWINGIITSYFTIGTRSEIPDLMKYVGRLLTSPDLDKKFMLDEKRVVEREYDLRISQGPDRMAWEAMRKILYEGHPLSRSTIGTPKSIRALDLDTAKAMRDRFYNPANIVLVISGNASADEAKFWVEEVLPGLDAGQRNKAVWRKQKLSLPLRETISVKDRSVGFEAFKQSGLANWQGTGDGQKDFFIQKFTTVLLESALDGGLAKPLRLDDFVVSDFGFYIFSPVMGQIQYFFEARPDDGVSLAKVSKQLETALKTLGARKISVKTFERIKKRLLREARRRADAPDFIRNRTYDLLTNGLEPLSSAREISYLEAITSDEVEGLIRSMANAHRIVDANIEKTDSKN